MRLIRNSERKSHNGLVVEKIYAEKDTVIEIEFDPKHRPVITMFAGV